MISLPGMTRRPRLNAALFKLSLRVLEVAAATRSTSLRILQKILRGIGSCDRLTDGLCVGRIVLLPFDVL